MKAGLVLRKTLLELVREPQMLIVTLLFPFFMLLITYIGYGQTYKLVTHTVLVTSSDPRSQPLLEQLAAQRYADGRPVFDLRLISDPALAEEELKAGSASILVGFATSLAGDLAARIYGDATSMRFIAASNLLSSVVGPYLDQAAGFQPLLRITEQPLSAAGPATEFDAYAPGMIIFAILMIIPQNAMLVARELRWGTFRRLRLSALRAGELLGGISAAQLVVAAGQVIVMFLAARLMGFQSRGGLPAAVLVGLLLSFSATGFGLIVACFSKNDSDALNIGATVAMLQVFLCGAFFPMPAMTLFHLGGHAIGPFDFLPATHSLLALQQILIGGAGLGEVAFRCGLGLGLSLLYFGLGIALFARMQMRQ